jgi:hypothetical protein
MIMEAYDAGSRSDDRLPDDSSGRDVDGVDASQGAKIL